LKINKNKKIAVLKQGKRGKETPEGSEKFIFRLIFESLIS